MAASTRRSHDDYTVGWICALPIEMAAAKLMLDEVHEDLPLSSTDHNTYILGGIKGHNVVIACLPSGNYGLVSANTVAMQLLSSFHSIRFGLMVGIGGGVPNSVADIRLGDVVVSKPTGIYGGVVQYDYGKALSGGFERTGMLNRPPQVLLTALSKLQSSHLIEGSRIAEFLADAKKKNPRQASIFTRPTQEDDLFFSDYHHIDSCSTNCNACDSTQIVSRPLRDDNEPRIHHGLIASGNQLVRDSKLRDRLSDELGVLCVEMEAAGLSNNFPCLVVRGICDYADSHKNKNWQGYASFIAAAYAKELLLCTSVFSMNQVKIVRNSSSDASEFDVPFNLTGVPAIENFLGRHEELENLWHHLQPENKGSRKVAVLHGLGGIGKTQLALHFAREHKEHFTAIFWLAGRSREILLQSLSSVLSRLPDHSRDSAARNEGEVDRNAKQVLRWLATPGNARWLLIFDNIDEYSPDMGDGYDVQKFFPIADHGSILVTSRLQSISELGQPFPLQVLDSNHATLLLWQSRHLPVPDTATRQEQDVVDLIDRLGGLPLAITIAGSFMRETGISVSEYLRYYQRSWHDLQSDTKPGRYYQQGNILQTWSVSYEEVRKRDPDVAELLLLLAHFDNRDIWYDLLKSGQRSQSHPTWYADILSNSLTFRKRVRILIEFSLLNTDEQRGSYMMHPVVQKWCLDMASIDTEARNKRWDDLALVSIGYTVPSRYEQAYWELQQRLLVHADYVREAWVGDHLTDNVVIWNAIHRMGTLYFDQEKLKEAELMYQRAFSGCQKTLGTDHVTTLNIVQDIGVLYTRQERWQEAELMYRQALAGYERVLGPDHISAIRVVNNLGALYLNLYCDYNMLTDAELMFQRALLGYEKALGQDHAFTLDIVNNLGVVYKDQGKWNEAINMYRRALRGYRNALGSDHTSTLNVIDNIGVLYRTWGKLDESAIMHQQALAGYQKTLGPDHIAVLRVFSNIGILYITQGKLKEAEVMLQRALAGFEKSLGPDHITTLHSVSIMGYLYQVRGMLEEAGTMYRRALAGYETALEPDNNRIKEIAGALKEISKKCGRGVRGFSIEIGLK